MGGVKGVAFRCWGAGAGVTVGACVSAADCNWGVLVKGGVVVDEGVVLVGARDDEAPGSARASTGVIAAASNELPAGKEKVPCSYIMLASAHYCRVADLPVIQAVILLVPRQHILVDKSWMVPLGSCTQLQLIPPLGNYDRMVGGRCQTAGLDVASEAKQPDHGFEPSQVQYQLHLQITVLAGLGKTSIVA